ncbi:MAG: ATP-binding cassette domain-containing protein [Janthinobacterium lividum]
MKRFFKVYLRVLAQLAPHRRAAAGLCAANLALVAVGFAEPVLFGQVIGGLGGAGPSLANILAWAAMGVLGIGAGMATSVVADRLAHRLRLRVIGRAYGHVLQLPPAHHARYPTGTLMKTLWSGADEMFWLWLGLFRDHLATVLCLIGLLPIALFLNPALGAVLIALAAAFAVSATYTIRRTQDGQRLAEDAHSAMAAQVGDVLGNAPLIRAFGRAPLEAEAFGKLAGDVVRHQFPVLGWWAGIGVMNRIASTAATVAIVGLGAWLHGRGQATTADIVTFMGFAGMLIGRLEGAVTIVARMGSMLPRLEDFFAILDAASTVPDPVGQPELPAGPGQVEFRGVRFAYPGGPAVLDGVDLVAQPGETIALVGMTGSGKSTAMSLLQRLWDPNEGAILVDGHDLRDVSLASLRDRIGTVPQDTMLLNRTIGENLRVGRPEATQAEVEQAARMAEAHDFIMRQPQGYDTLVGERGAALSGGQRQRLAIARTLLRDPRILILDEATSALDGATEEKVVRAMQAAAAGRTTFVIAHRLATIRDADRILFFSDGAVAEAGSFDELVARDGLFAALARTQLLAPASTPQRDAATPHLHLIYSRDAATAATHGASQPEEALEVCAG